MYAKTRHANSKSKIVTATAQTLALLATFAIPCASAPAHALRISGSAPGQQASTRSSSKDEGFKKADGSGTLMALLPGGKQAAQCPLKHTDVDCEVSGYVARVTVKQTFHNPSKDKIEALYTFPLSDSGAVDEMVMKVGDRTIHGTIKKRDEARQIYEQARANGQVASLLDQERTNIFTQSVANIAPGKEIEITIKYVETLPYENGKYTFAFPTVVGPRFIPGNPASSGPSNAGGASRAEVNAATNSGAHNFGHDTDVVPDGSRITPPVVANGERSGHDINIKVHLNAGMPVGEIESKLHQVDIMDKAGARANISLTNKNAIPNKDFVLTWAVADSSIKSGYLTYKQPGDKEGYFTLMLMPPKRPTVEQIAPKEMIFVIDCSGSQSGPPLDKAKETMNYILDHMGADDTFQIIAFNNSVRTFADAPEKVSEPMKDRAHAFIASLTANGGTWMAPAVENACKIPADGHRLRIVTFMTDGYVGNDYEVIGMVKKMRGTSRWFPFGTGNSVNRTLIDGIAGEGGGEPDYVLLNSSAKEAGKKFYDRISTPVLTDVKLNFAGVTTREVYPRELSDVWAQKPLYFKGKYTAGGAGTVTLTGFSGGHPYEQKMKINFPEKDTANEGIASLWARAKVDRLMSEDLIAVQAGKLNQEIKDEIVATALAHHIMSQYTSFVAVDEKTVVKDGKLQTITTPVEIPEGVNRDKIFSEDAAPAQRGRRASGMVMASAGSPRYFKRFSGVNSGGIASPYASSYGGGGGVGAGGSYNSMALGASRASRAGMPMSSFGATVNSTPAPMSSPAPMAELASNIPNRSLHQAYYNGAKHLQAAMQPELPIAGDARTAAKEKSKDMALDDSKVEKFAKSEPQQNDAVTIILRTAKITKSQMTALKELGFSIEKTTLKAGKLTLKGKLKLPSKLKQLTALDFVLTAILDSDRK